MTGPAGAHLDELLPAARSSLAPVLARARRRPLAPAPEPSDEPAHATAFLASCPVPEPPFARAPSVRSPADGTGLAELGIVELLEAFASGAATPSALLDALRARWRDRREGSGVLAEIDGADEAAAAADRAWTTGTARGLEGIPFAVKDIIDVAGAAVTCGSFATGDRTASVDATAVARLRNAGAIPVLMVATTEFACGATENVRYGPARNPWDPERWTGGSSSGSGAAVASRYVPLALGTDTAGSVRVPSALCGVSGVKPTYGLVPRTGVASLSWSLDHVGPIARSAADLRLVLAHLAGPDGKDPSAVPEATAEGVRHHLRNGSGTPEPLRPLRVGVATSWFDEHCDPGVLAAWEEALAVLMAGGAEVRPVDLGFVEQGEDDFALILLAELASNHEGRLEELEIYDSRVQGFIAQGTVPSAVDHLRALRRRASAMREAATAFHGPDGVDVLLTPGVGIAAPRVSATSVEMGGREHPLPDCMRRNTSPFNLLGFPAVMVPAGFVGGLPVGVQVVGPPWADATCLAVAELLQSRTDHHLRRPEARGASAGATAPA